MAAPAFEDPRLLPDTEDQPVARLRERRKKSKKMMADLGVSLERKTATPGDQYSWLEDHQGYGTGLVRGGSPKPCRP